MELIFGKHAAFIILCIMSEKAFGFNLDITTDNAEFLTSPVLDSLGKKEPPGSLIPQLDPSIPPSFYGHNLNMIKPTTGNRKPRLMVGAPRMTDPDNPQDQTAPTKPVIDEEPKSMPKGAINSCPVSNLFAKPPSVPVCSSSHPPPLPGDALGGSLATRPNGEMSACSPARVQDCSTDKYSPGYCFTSNNYGTDWKMDDNSAGAVCPEGTVDVLFVLDGSGSVHGHFGKVKAWVKKISRKLKPQLEAAIVQIGVVQYSHWFSKNDMSDQKYIKTEIEIGKYKTYANLATAIDKIKHQNYTTYTGHALKKVRDDFKGSKRFSSENNKQVMFLMTDGQSKDSDLILPNANYLRNMGVTTFAVGVGQAVQSELREIATGNKQSKERVYSVDGFNELDSLVSQLQTKILDFVLEGGGSASKASYKLELAQTGFSTTLGDKQNGRLHLGAVGAYDWSGTITKYDSIDDEEPDIPKYADVQAVLPNRTKESYLGYSVITGFFDDTSSEWVAAGAPRYMLMGAVVVYKPQDNSATFHDHVTLMGHPSKRQLGAYFGGSVLTADVNNDGKDDLFVGSPLYVASNYDEGRVFVYVSRPTNSLQAWGKDSYEPLELFGDHLPGGRFGTAMANAGDLNMDGYNDVIVGAPLTEVDRGAVFVYHGNENGVDTQFAQKILASELKGVQLKYFGQSLQGGVDLDGNKYPDIAVGAPKSDTVVIFRSRPVVKIDATIEYLTGDIDIFECIDKNYQNCSRIQVCFTASGTSVETVVGIRFNVTLDIEKAGATKRIEFRKSPDLIASGLPTWTQDLHLAKDNRTCLTKNIHMKSNIADYDSAIKTELEFDLLSSHTEKPLSSVRDPSKVNVKSTLLNFAKRCGNDDKCIHDLRLEASLSLPEYRTESDNKDLTENGKVLIVDQKTADVPVTVKVNLTNNGENAFDTKIKVMYTSLISLSTLDNRQAKPPSNSCIVEDSDPVDVGNGMKSQIFRYNYRTNIMRQYAWCYFEFNLITENLRSNGNLETFTVNVTAFTSDSSSSSSEKNEADNSWGLSPKVKYRSDFSLIKKSVTEIPFNYTSEEYNITSVHEIGGNTPDFEVAFEIRGEGYSNIPEAEATLTYPMKTSQGDMLLYLYKVECKPKSINSKASCSCHQDFVNIHNLTLENPNGNNTDGSYVTITPPEYQIEAKTFNCFNTDPGRNFTCAALQCNIKNLRDSDQMDFIAHFRLWSSSIMFNGTNFTEVELHSRYEVNTVKSPYIIDEKGDVSQMQTEEIITKAKKFAESEGTGTQKDYLWIIILAAVGGLLLLIAIVLILWKVGFFKSKYADMKKDAQDDVADESDIQGNGNESTTDMVG